MSQDIIRSIVREELREVVRDKLQITQVHLHVHAEQLDRAIGPEWLMTALHDLVTLRLTQGIDERFDLETGSRAEDDSESHPDRD